MPCPTSFSLSKLGDNRSFSLSKLGDKLKFVGHSFPNCISTADNQLIADRSPAPLPWRPAAIVVFQVMPFDWTTIRRGNQYRSATLGAVSYCFTSLFFFAGPGRGASIT